MESLLGFKVDFWDYATFAVLALLVLAGLITVVWLAGLPGRIAIARKHPDAEAVKMMGYAGFLAAVPWIQAFIWAFKPTDIVDIRRFPAQEARGIDEEIARLSGKPAPAEAKPAEAAKPAPAASNPPEAEPPGMDANKQS
jgi:hypothetical protein